MKTFKTLILTFLLFTAGWWLLSRLNVMPSLPEIFEPAPVTIEKTGVWVKEIKALAQLVTVSAYDEIVADTSRTLLPEYFRIPSVVPRVVLPRSVLGERKLVIVGKTTAHVGINMSSLKEKDVIVAKDSIHITLPKAEILDVMLNPSDVNIFIEEGQWDNNAIVQLKNKIRGMAAAKVVQKGLLAQSEQKARTIFTDFFKAAGFTWVQIDFR
jgi:hypothetical protein